MFFFCFPLCLVQPALAWTTFRVGLYCGFFIILAISFILTGRSQKHPDSYIFHILLSPLQFVMCHRKTTSSSCRLLKINKEYDWHVSIVVFPQISCLKQNIRCAFFRCCVHPLRECVATGADLSGRFPVDPVHLPVGHQHIRMETGRSQPRPHLRDQSPKQPLTPAPV